MAVRPTVFRPLAILVIVATSGCAASHAPITYDHPSPDAAGPTDPYLTLVLRYRAGDDAAIEALARQNAAELRDALNGLPRSIPAAAASARLSPAALVAAAMAAHVQVARHANVGLVAGRHLTAAVRLAGMLPATDSTKAFRASWHLAAGMVHVGFAARDEAIEHFESARALQPDNAAVLLALGSVHETAGAISLRHSGEAHARASLERAADLFREALARDPDLHEARLRRVRTLDLVGRTAEAEEEAQRLPPSIDDPALQYFLLLITGAIDERHGRLDAAAARYRLALVMCDGCQTPALALSHLRLLAGDRDDAVASVERLLVRQPAPNDPWWVYERGQWMRIDTMLEELRRQVPE